MDGLYKIGAVSKITGINIPTLRVWENKFQIVEPNRINGTQRGYTKNDLEQAKCSIAEKITKHFDDVLFEMVCQEMGNNYLFQSDNYLTEAGYDMFEDEWFEFYHEHHGDILYRVKHNLFE